MTDFTTQARALVADNDGCRCWDYSAALGHEGHCCFLRDDRNEVRHSEAWRALEDICHVPRCVGGGR